MRPKVSFLLAGVAAAGLASLFDVRPSHALCLTSGDAGANNCATFDNSGTTTAIQAYTTSNLTGNSFFQIGFSASDSNSYSISNIEYAYPSNAFISYGAPLTTGNNSSPNYGSIVASSGPIGTPFQIRYTMASVVPVGVTITSVLLNNNNGNSSGGILQFDSTNNFDLISRNSVSATAVPAPLPILGAAAAFSRVRRLRRASKKLSRT